nr:hypothetical transcript [Hymenolepis microstoma]
MSRIQEASCEENCTSKSFAIEQNKPYVARILTADWPRVLNMILDTRSSQITHYITFCANYSFEFVGI